jgi:hypothetical protein
MAREVWAGKPGLVAADLPLKLPSNRDELPEDEEEQN